MSTSIIKSPHRVHTTTVANFDSKTQDVYNYSSNDTENINAVNDVMTGLIDNTSYTSFDNKWIRTQFKVPGTTELWFRSVYGNATGDWQKISTEITYKDYSTNGSIVIYRVGKLRMLHIFSSSLTLTKGTYNTVATLDDRDRPIGSIPVYFPVLNNNASASTTPLIMFHSGSVDRNSKTVRIWPYIDGLTNVRATTMYISDSD